MAKYTTLIKAKRAAEKQARRDAGEIVSSDTDFSADDMSDIDPEEYQAHLLQI